MTRALWFFVKVAILIGIAVWLVDHPGSVSLDWQGYTVETSVGIAVVVLAVLLAIGIAAYRLVRAVRRTPARLRDHMGRRRRERGYLALTRGMVAVAAGDRATAQRMAKRADGLLDEPPLTLLLSAQAAQLNGDDDAARRYFTGMLARPETAFLGLRGLLTQSLRTGDRANALEYARQAQALQPRAPWLLTTVFDLETRAGNWAAAEAVLRQAVDEGVITEPEGRHNRSVLFIEQSLEAERAGRSDESLSYARSAFELLPGFVPAALLLSGLYRDAGSDRRATKVLTRSWKLHPHPETAEAYGALVTAVDPLERMRLIQRLAAQAPGHVESLLAVAAAAMASRLWGEARSHLQKALALQPSRRVFSRLAELERAEHADEMAARAWLAQGAGSPMDAAWTCRACGHAAVGWSGRCGACGAFDSLDWKAPSLTQALVAAPADGAFPTVIEASR